MTADHVLEDQLLNRAANGDSEALGELFQQHHNKLERIVKFRMDSRLSGRLDVVDIIQEAFIEATKRFEYYLKHRKTTFFLWLRYLTLQKLNELHRHHFGAQIRSMNREVSIFNKSDAAATTGQIAAHLFDDKTSASQALIRDESRAILENALGQMDALDQEVLALRHFEQLSNTEVADSLGINSAAASKRFVRALQKLRSIVDQYSPDP